MVDDTTLLVQVANRAVMYALRIDPDAMRFELVYKVTN